MSKTKQLGKGVVVYTTDEERYLAEVNPDVVLISPPPFCKSNADEKTRLDTEIEYK